MLLLQPSEALTLAELLAVCLLLLVARSPPSVVRSSRRSAFTWTLVCPEAGDYIFVSQTAKQGRVATLLRLETLGNCPEFPNLPNRFTETTLFPVGRTVWGRATVLISRNYTRSTKVTARMYKCNDKNDPHCEPFQTWRFGDESCGLLTMKNMIWSPLFNLVPPLTCHPLRAGIYSLENVTVDVDRLKVINFPEKGFWKVALDIEFDKIPNCFCYYFEATFLKVRV